MKALRRRWGWEGSGWYWLIVEVLRSEDKHRLKLSDLHYESLADDMKCDTDKVKEFIADCVELGLLKNGEGYIISQRLQRDMEHMNQLREQRSKAGRKSAEARKRNLEVIQ